MTDIAAFFAPTSLPAAAGAVASAPKTGDASSEFANLLAELQGAGGQPNALLTLNAPAIAQVTPIKAVNLGSNTGVQATLENLLANGADGQAVNPDATLVAQLAALQNALQALQTDAQAAPNSTAPQTNKLGLRGTVAPAALDATAQLPKNEATAIAQAKPDDTTVPPELLAALNNQKPVQTHNNNKNAKAPTGAQPADGALQPQAAATEHAAKSAENNNPSSNNFGANTNAGGLAQQPSHTAPQAPSANPQAFAAAVNAAQTQSVDTPNITLSTTPPAPAAVPLDALAVNIARKFDAGVSKFDITLHPAELGKLEISLSVADDGRIHAALRAERPETLDMLQRDARSLETQLRQAGLDVGSNSLSFSLSQGNGQRQQHQFNGWPAFADAQATAGAAKEQALTAYITARDRDGVDIRV